MRWVTWRSTSVRPCEWADQLAERLTPKETKSVVYAKGGKVATANGAGAGAVNALGRAWLI